MKRRDFTLLGLAGAAWLATRPAWAEDAPQPTPPSLRSKVTAHQSGSTLYVSLAVENVGDEAADVFVKRGEEPAPHLTVAVQGEEPFELQPLAWIGEHPRTRAGPRRHYAPVAASDSVNVGSYRFALPEGLRGAALQLQVTATVQADGASLELPPTAITVDAPEA